MYENLFRELILKVCCLKKRFRPCLVVVFGVRLADTPDATRFLAGFLIFILFTAGSFVVVAKKSAEWSSNDSTCF
jgi:hypothetical protein